jgi:O-antigen/teichoic acid export membrane protein
MEVAEEAVKGGFLLFTGNTSATVILTIASIIIARLLGPPDYGLYSITLIIPSLMLIFTDFGINPALIKFSAQFRSEGRGKMVSNLIRTGFLFKLTTGLSMFLISFLLADFLTTYLLKRPSISSLVQLASLVIIGQVFFSTSNSVFVGIDKMKNNALTSITQAIVKVVIAPTLIVLGLGVFGALIGHVLGYLAAGFLGVLLVLKIYRSRHHSSENKPSFTVNLRPMITYGIPLYTSRLLLNLLGQYQPIILAWFTSDTEIGNYSVAIMFTTLIMLVSTPISTALFPAFSKLNPDSDKRDLKKLFQYSNRYILLLIAPASVFLAIASHDLVFLLYGSQYTLAPFYLTIYSTIFLYSGFALVLGGFFKGIGRTDISLKATVIQIIIAAPLTLALTYLYAVPGLIISNFIFALFPLIYTSRIAYHKYKMRFDLKCTLKIYLAAFLSTIPALIFIYISPFSCLLRLVFITLSFTSVYLTLIPAIGAINEEDLNNLTLIFSKIKLISKLAKVVLAYEAKILNLNSLTSIRCSLNNAD